MTSLRIRIVTLSLVTAGLSLALLAACNDGDDAGKPTGAPPTPTAQSVTAPPPLTTAAANESGEAPIFYRTFDRFETLRANERYLVVLRITNGYAEEKLVVVAERVADGLTAEFESLLSQPIGDEAPGSYYPVPLELPESGAWLLTIVAGDDEVVIPVEVAPDESY